MVIRRVAVVMNGRAGALLQGEHQQTLHDAFAVAGLEPLFIAPNAGTLPERMTQAAESGTDAVVVAGGDGTVACAALAMAGRELPLAILPFGTMNLLAKDLHLPICDTAAAVALIGQGRVRSIDVGEVNGHMFLCASMLGLPARIGRTREQTRGKGVQAITRMSQAVWRQLLRSRPLRVGLVADGEALPIHASALTITVNAVDPASGRTFGRPVLDGGVFGVYVVGHLGVRSLLGLVLRLLVGRRNTALDERVAHAVDIAGPKRALHVMNDGELAMLAPPLQYRLRPKALRVLVPAE